VEEGFAEIGRVAHTGSRQGCYNWWQTPNSRVKRSIIMDDFVFSLSDSQLKVNHLDQLDVDRVILDLEPIYY
jgi:hypothetical protein